MTRFLRKWFANPYKEKCERLEKQVVVLRKQLRESEKLRENEENERREIKFQNSQLQEEIDDLKKNLIFKDRFIEQLQNKILAVKSLDLDIGYYCPENNK